MDKQLTNMFLGEGLSSEREEREKQFRISKIESAIEKRDIDLDYSRNLASRIRWALLAEKPKDVENTAFRFYKADESESFLFDERFRKAFLLTLREIKEDRLSTSMDTRLETQIDKVIRVLKNAKLMMEIVALAKVPQIGENIRNLFENECILFGADKRSGILSSFLTVRQEDGISYLDEKNVDVLTEVVILANVAGFTLFEFHNIAEMSAVMSADL